MKILVNEEQKLEKNFLRLIMKLPPEQVLGVTTILGVPLVEDNIEGDIVEDITEKIMAQKEIAKNSIDQSIEIPEEKEELKKNNEDTENIGTAMKTIVTRFNEMKNAPTDIIDTEEENEDKKDNARSAMDILYDAFDKFRALNIQQKKSLIKIMKAGG